MAKKEVKTEAEESSRMWASASFVGVLIVIGVPLWWKTTEVYRVSLPFEKINAFDALPFAISTNLVVLANDEATATEMAELIDRSFDHSNVIKLNITKRVLPHSLRNTLESVADEVEASEEVASSVDATQPNTLFVVQRAPLYTPVWVGTERVVFFRDTRAGEPLINALSEWIYQTSVLSGAATGEDESLRVRYPPAAGYHVVLSVAVPELEHRVDFPAKQAMDGGPLINALSEWIYQTSVLSGAATGEDESLRVRYPPAAGYHVVLSVAVPELEHRVDFPAKQAMDDYIGSFVDELSGIHNFTLKSQWLYLLDFDFEATEIKEDKYNGHHFLVPEMNLYLLLTKLEERTATHVSLLPTINLVLYVVPCKIAPLIIYPADEHPGTPELQGFMSPKWGGVALANPTAGECRPAAERKPHPMSYMAMFVSHLRPLLGIMDPRNIDGATMLPLRSVTPRRWEADALMRLRLLEQLAAGKLALQSLAQLLAEISNIVINDEVGTSINSAVEGIHKATELMSKGHLEEAYRVSQEAFLAAEAAFSDPSLLALLYFPDDQKYAIYIPLFLPIMFPVLLSLKNLFLWMRGKPLHKEKAD